MAQLTTKTDAATQEKKTDGATLTRGATAKFSLSTVCGSILFYFANPGFLSLGPGAQGTLLLDIRTRSKLLDVCFYINRAKR